MIRKEDFVEIRALAKAGIYRRDIAEKVVVHPKTVGRALKRGAPPTGPRRDRWLVVTRNSITQSRGAYDRMTRCDQFDSSERRSSPSFDCFSRGLQPPNVPLPGEAGHSGSVPFKIGSGTTWSDS
jgi:hypothetical protein